ncbi:MAG: ABC transporter permease [Pseudolactococcus laudensis]|uniref:ABC transporter permease n=1 Tax=Pseudolactococcus laudensis TaxID=1494461 RepID=UPI003F98C474
MLSFSGVGNGEILTTNSLLSASLRNLFLSQAGLVIIAASFFGQEFSNAYLRTTLLTIPSRMKLVISKILVLSIIVLGIGIISNLICLGIIIGQYQRILTFPLVNNFLTQVMIAMLSWLFITWLTASLILVTKSQTIPIAIMFSLILGLSQMFAALTKFAKYLPDLATMNLFFSNHAPNLLNGYQGLLVQFFWTLNCFIIGLLLIHYQDVR